MSEERSLNFLEEIVEEDIAAGKNDGRVLTRFPPRTKWLPAYRPRQINMLKLWIGATLRRTNQPSF